MKKILLAVTLLAGTHFGFGEVDRLLKEWDPVETARVVRANDTNGHYDLALEDLRKEEGEGIDLESAEWQGKVLYRLHMHLGQRFMDIDKRMQEVVDPLPEQVVSLRDDFLLLFTWLTIILPEMVPEEQRTDEGVPNFGMLVSNDISLDIPDLVNYMQYLTRLLDILNNYVDVLYPAVREEL